VVLTSRETTFSSTVTSGKRGSRRRRRRGSRSGAWATYWRMRGPAVLDFLRSTHVGRTAPPAEENWDSEGSEGDPGKQERVERKRRRRTEWRSKRSSDPRAPGIGFPWCGIGFLPFVIFLVRLWCVISFGEWGGEEAATEPGLGCSGIGAGRQTGLE